MSMDGTPPEAPGSDPGKVIDIRSQVEARVRDEQVQLGQDKAEKEPIDTEFVLDCLRHNERGDGVLFASLHRGKFCYEATAGRWLVWNGAHWEGDITGKALAAVEAVALRYQAEALALGRQIEAGADEEATKRLQDQRNKLYRRAERLRAVKGRNNTLNFATTCGDGSLVITGDCLDTKPWLLACRNGVVNLETGELEPGRPDDYLEKATPLDFPTGAAISHYLATGENSPCPNWEAFLVEILNGRQHCAEYLQRFLGYSVSGLIREHVVAIWHGANGRNGKGTVLECLQGCLGPLAAPVAAELLLDQGRARSSAAPSPDVMQLKGLRVAIASEVDQGRKFSTARVKSLAGGDRLAGRHPNDKHITTFLPSHQLVLATNAKPKAPAEDAAFWARLHLLEFELSFVDKPSAPHERPVDRRLTEKLMAEASGILAWLVRGCLMYQKVGLAPPPEVLAATSSYRESEDLLGAFIEERIEQDQDAVVTARALYDAFKIWYAANVSEKVPSVKWFGDQMTRKFSKDLGGPGKTTRYLGLTLRVPFEG